MFSSWPDIELVWVSRNAWRSGRHLRVAAADRWVLWLVREGTVEAHQNGHTHEVKAGQACLQQAGKPRELRAQSSAVWDSIGFRLPPHALQGYLPTAHVWQLDAAEQTLLDATFPLLDQWHHDATVASRRSAASALQLVLSLSLRHAPAAKNAPAGPAWLQLALERLEEAPRRDIAALSREAGYSPAQFRARFQELTGYSPREYAAACLDREARRLLLQTDDSIAQIATRLEFSATAHFIRFFRRLNATTPARFRRSGGI